LSVLTHVLMAMGRELDRRAMQAHVMAISAAGNHQG
jgi:hypothetical protein